MSNKVDILYFLEQHTRVHKTGKSSEIRVTCPRCHHHNDKLYINVIKGTGNCKHCEYSPNTIQILRDVCNLPLQSIKDLFQFSSGYTSLQDLKTIFEPKYELGTNKQIRKIPLPYGFRVLDECDNNIFSELVKNYALTRFSWEEIKKYDLGYTLFSYRSRLIFPVYQFGEVATFTTRAIFPHQMRYQDPDNSPKGSLLYNYDNAVKTKHVILVEGLPDAIRVGDKSAALMTSQLSRDQQEKLLIFNHLTIMLDSIKKDPKILDKIDKIIDKTQNFIQTIDVVFLPKGDPNDFSKEDLEDFVKDAINIHDYRYIVEKAQQTLN